MPDLNNLQYFNQHFQIVALQKCIHRHWSLDCSGESKLYNDINFTAIPGLVTITHQPSNVQQYKNPNNDPRGKKRMLPKKLTSLLLQHLVRRWCSSSIPECSPVPTAARRAQHTGYPQRCQRSPTFHRKTRRGETYCHPFTVYWLDNIIPFTANVLCDMYMPRHKQNTPMLISEQHDIYLLFSYFFLNMSL